MTKNKTLKKPVSLCLTKQEYPVVFEKLVMLFKPIQSKPDNKQSFRDFCSKLLLEICTSKLPQQIGESQEQSDSEVAYA